MAVIRRLITSLEARTSKFQRGMKQAQGSLQRFRKTAMNVATGLAALGSFSILSGIRKATGEIDKIAKLSDRIGLSTEAIVGLAQGAEITGTEFERVSKGLEKFAQSIGEARQGLATPLRALEMLGIQGREFLDLSLEDQLNKVADGMARLTDQQSRVTAAAQLFGRSGREMVNLLQGGAPALKAYREEAEKLGLTFSREEAAKVEALNDTLQRLGKVWTGIARQAAVELAPALKDVAVSLLEVVRAGKLAGTGWGAIKDLGMLLGEGQSPTMRHGAIDNFKKKIEQRQRDYEELSERISRLKAEIDKAGAAGGAMGGMGGTTAPSVAGGGGPFSEDFMAALGVSVPRLLAEQRALESRARALEAAMKPSEAFKESQRDLEDQMLLWKAGVESGRLGLEELESQGRDFGVVITAGFNDAIFSAQKFSDVLKGVAQQIASIALNKAILAPIGDAIGSGIGNIWDLFSRGLSASRTAQEAVAVGTATTNIFVPAVA